jgi:hypothetical protein
MRRASPRFNRGRISTVSGGPSPPSPALDPLTILSGEPVVGYFVGDLGITDAGGGFAAAWADQSPAVNHWTQATGVSQPSFAADAAINNRVALTGDGIDDVMASVLNFAANYWIYLIFSPITWTNADGIFGAASATNRMAIRQAGVTPQLQQQSNLGNNTVDASLGAWHRGEAQFGTTVADYIHIGPTTDNAVPNTGTLAGTGRVIFALSGASNFSASRLACVIMSQTKPAAGLITDLDTWAVGYYGSGVAV